MNDPLLRRDAPVADEALAAPGPLLMLMEARAPWEYAAMLAATPWLAQLPRGDGHPVVVFPGLGASDLTTRPLRRFLQRGGWSPYAWNLGANLGPRPGVLDHCRSLVQQAARRHGMPASLIGWSLGGIYAREIAKEMPDQVRCVVTLGTPFAGHPRATNAWRLYERVSGRVSKTDERLLEALRRPPPCPTTSIYSRTDGVVAWPCSLNEAAPQAENIEVHASHLGMAMNPLALYAIGDRLLQDPLRWQPFSRHGARRWFYRAAPPAAPQPMAAAA